MLNYFEDTNELLLQAVRELVTEQTKDFSQSSGEIEQLKATKADIDGEYPKLRAGNLTSHIGFTEKVPYLLRTAGGAADIADREEDTVVGGTIVWNQLFNYTTQYPSEYEEAYGITRTNNNDGTVTLNGTFNGVSVDNYLDLNSAGSQWLNAIQGHKYLYICPSFPGAYLTILCGNTAIMGYKQSNGSTIANCLQSGTTYVVARISPQNGAVFGNWKYYLNVIDLTLMFGSAIADYLYTLESGTPGAGVALFKKMFPEDYYAYDEGTLMSVKTSAHITTGLNQLDPETHQAKLVGGIEYQITGSYTALSFRDVNGNTSVPTPDSDGKFTPAMQGILTVTGDDDTTCVHLVWDGEYDGVVEPYEANTYALDPDLELRGIPKLDANNNIYYDGDVYEASGKVTRKYGIRAYENGDENLANAITDGTNTVYLLDSPVEESADPFETPQKVHNFGTEEYVDTRTIPIPVGHSTVYITDLKAKLEAAPQLPENDGYYILHMDQGIASYTPLTNELPAMPSADGDYSLKCSVSSGTVTLTWEAIE